MTTMKAAQLKGKETIAITELNRPTFGEDELLLKVKAASICGTDVRMYKNGYANVDDAHPLTLGHEIAGVIAAVGANVTTYQAGMRVAIAPNIGCGTCDQCVSGNTHLCDTYDAFGINLSGGFAEYMVVPEKAIRQGNVTLLADDINLAEAALVEPFSCVLNGQEIAGVFPGDTVLIIGSGPIGIMHAMLAFSQGAYKVIMNDTHQERLEAAQTLVPGLLTVSSDELLEGIMRETKQKGVDLCIIAAPAPQAQEASFEYMAMNGRLLFFGGLPKGKEVVSLNTNILHYKQLRVFGCTRASLATYRTAMKLVGSGRVPLGKLITGTFPIDAFEHAMANAANSVGLKNVIVFD